MTAVTNVSGYTCTCVNSWNDESRHKHHKPTNVTPHFLLTRTTSENSHLLNGVVECTQCISYCLLLPCEVVIRHATASGDDTLATVVNSPMIMLIWSDADKRRWRRIKQLPSSRRNQLKANNLHTYMHPCTVYNLCNSRLDLSHRLSTPTEGLQPNDSSSRRRV